MLHIVLLCILCGLLFLLITIYTCVLCTWLDYIYKCQTIIYTKKSMHAGELPSTSMLSKTATKLKIRKSLFPERYTKNSRNL
uniref:Uncharacterized protein n=1 Tax=Siphoviridae sp. ctTkm23 TaxID=2825522 RepID=A0A8S5TRR8_9CAUD|nr:MAG TPA: hypothetical protein [Siphoviridae sp. ctTkm23]